MGVMSVAYTTINGKIVSEKRNGVPSDYIPDALGSTIALLSDTHQITDKWTYWPNGQVRTRTGTNPTPFTFVGTRGYHSDIVNNSAYVQARILRPELARWQTVDPRWPIERAYLYAGANPASAVDPSGTNTIEDICQALTNPTVGPPTNIVNSWPQGKYSGYTEYSYVSNHPCTPSDVATCNKNCQNDCQELGIFGTSTGHAGTTSDLRCHCGCSCQQSGCSPMQALFCETIAQKLKGIFQYVGCRYRSSHVTNAENCDFKRIGV